ncbi:MAG: DUF1361 domain-containing protein [Bacteroidota bacterium]
MIARFLRKYPLLIASLLLLGFNTALIAMRIAYSHRLYYVFLMWNLFLAVIPFLFMELGRLLYNRKKILWASWSLFFLSLLFLPNSPYIITDLFHLKPRHSVPFWYDTLMIFSFATTGVVFFFATLKSMYRFLKHFSQPLVAQLSISLIIYLCAFGVYLGRYLRFNSWDILTHPGYLFSQIFERILFPLDHPKTWAMTLVYGTLLCLGWMLMNLLGDKQETRALP